MCIHTKLYTVHHTCTYIRVRRRGRVRHADLWQQFDALVSARPAATVLMTKVKAHATAADVASGHVSRQDRSGNDAADALAVAGARAHAVPAGERHEMQQRVQVAMQVQRLMLEIVVCRQSAQKSQLRREASEEEIRSSSSTENTSGSTSDEEVSMMPWCQRREEDADWMPPD